VIKVASTEGEGKIMAIHTAVVETVAGWFTTGKRVEKNVDLTVAQTTTQRSGENKQAIMQAWPEEEEELGRVRKAKMDLMKFQTINRRY
jgi:hypothetical protein